jgi:hypothetical protein
MSKEENKSLDILGIKPISSAIDKTTEGTLKGIGEFLSLVCKPALGEFGFLLQDKVRNWRLNNVVKMLEKAKGKLEYENGSLEVKSHPRVAISIIEKSSYIDDEIVQEMWAGLFASSCNKDGQDDENLIFIDLLQKLTFSQAKILNYSIINSRKILFPNSLVLADEFTVHCDEIKKITGINDIHRIDIELDYLRTLGLIDETSGGFDVDNELIANLQPSYLALSLFVKSQGSSDNPDIFWKDEIITSDELDKEKAENVKDRKKKE